MPNYTFGYEAEFDNNVEALVARLNDRGLAGSSEMHGYHCRCEDVCSFDTSWPYRAQTDSSCGGEVISNVCSDIGQGREWMTALQDAAVEVDAEPSYRAGFHVHVGVNPMHRAGLFHHHILHAYLLWEPTLGDLAQGRFGSVRSFNTPMRESLAYVHLMPDEDDFDIPSAVWDVLDEGVAARCTDDLRYGGLDTFNDMDAATQQYVLNRWTEAALNFLDRHAWLSFQTRGNRTVEFRLWNSTRSAWRMEMAVRTSLLFVNPEAYEDLLAPQGDRPMERLLAIARLHDPGLDALIERQMASPKSDGPLTVMLAA